MAEEATGKKKMTKAEEAEYWESMRHAYIEKNDLMQAAGYVWWDPLAFYRFIFPEGTLQEAWSGGIRREIERDGKPNAIALKFGPDKRTNVVNGAKVESRAVRRFTVTDDLEGVGNLVRSSVRENSPCYMAPVSWYGKRNCAKNARFLHAFAVDLDGVSPVKCANLLKQIANGHRADLPKSVSLPQPSFIVNSGTGLHLYYVLDRPRPLLPKHVPFLQQLKRRLTDVVWTDYTSEHGGDERQYQGIYQGFRMPGTATRLNGGKPDSKTSAGYEAAAFAWVPEGEYEPPRCSLDYLIDYCGIRGRDIPAELRECRRTKGGRTPLAEAAEMWPEWYDRRVVRGEDAGHWTCKRDLYDWWLRTIDEKAKEGGRYYAVLGLVTFARKCGVPKEQVEADAFSLVGKLDGLTTDPSNHFTEYDAMCAVDAYDDDDLVTYTRDYISRRSLIPIEANKRNGRTQEQHMDYLNNLRKMRRDVLGEDEYKNNGRPKKSEQVLAFAAEHPGMSQRAIAKELGVSPTTVNKWLRGDALEEYAESRANAGEEAGGQASVEASFLAYLTAALACCAVLPLHALF